MNLLVLAVPLLPPPEFDYPYRGELTEYSHSIEVVHALCESIVGPREKPYRGCAVWAGGKCTIIYPNAPYQGIDPLDIRRHEIGHCNGWKH